MGANQYGINFEAGFIANMNSATISGVDLDSNTLHAGVQESCNKKQNIQLPFDTTKINTSIPGIPDKEVFILNAHMVLP